MNPTKQLVQNRSSLLIFRDCLKLANRMVSQEQKIQAIRRLLRKQFEKHKQVFDQDHIKLLKMNAVKGISNYIIHTVQMQYKLNKKKPMNIMDEQQNARQQGQQDLEQKYFQTSQNTQKLNEIK